VSRASARAFGEKADSQLWSLALFPRDLWTAEVLTDCIGAFLRAYFCTSNQRNTGSRMATLSQWVYRRGRNIPLHMAGLGFVGFPWLPCGLVHMAKSIGVLALRGNGYLLADSNQIAFQGEVSIQP